MSLGTLWKEVVAPVFNFERGIPRTLRDSLWAPGKVIRRYLEGQRRRYANPFSYLMIGVAVALLVSSLVRNDEALASQIRETAGGSLTQFLSPEQIDTFIDLQVRFSRQASIHLLILCLPFAALLRLFFRGGAIAFAEALVFALFAFGTAYFLSLPTSLVFALSGSLQLEATLTILILVLVIAIASWQFFDGRWWAVVKAVFAFAIAYFAFSSIMAASMLFYVLRLS